MGLSTARRSGPIGRDRLVELLDAEVVPLRLACVAPSGWPLVVALWFTRRGDELLCATQESSALVRALRHDPRAAFDVSLEQPPYRGVRGRAEVRIEPDAGLEVLRALLVRYLGTDESPFARRLLVRETPEVVLRLDPVEVSGWDYGRRMR
jgi:nitroimidazol reductase NimA-like FMN-containing flavoprotein (pyridoxamine 5'-phosphate oxidase superfamily)